MAVGEEDYASAAAAKAEVAALLSRLPPSKALLATLLDRIATCGPGSSGVTPAERLATVQQLGAIGDMDAAPALAACLHTASEPLAEAAEAALWQLFSRCPGGGGGDSEEGQQQRAELLMQQGVLLMHRREQREEAVEVFSQLIEQAPHWAEASRVGVCVRGGGWMGGWGEGRVASELARHVPLHITATTPSVYPPHSSTSAPHSADAGVEQAGDR